MKYILSFLLIFSLTVNECSIFSQTNTTKYHQVSTVNSRTAFNHKQGETYVYTPQIISIKTSSITQFVFRNLLKFCEAQTNLIQKSQTVLFQKIISIKVQQDFLSQRITSQDAFPSLYIA